MISTDINNAEGPIQENGPQKRSTFKVFFVIFIGLIMLVILFLSLNYFLNKDINISIKEEKLSLNLETTEYVTEYVTELASFLKITGDPFFSEEKFGQILYDITPSSSSIIFNGVVYDDLELKLNNDSYSLIPKGYLGGDSFEVISIEQQYPEDFFDIDDEVRKQILKIAYKYLDNKKEAEKNIQKYLEEVKIQGLIVNFEYNTDQDVIRLEYPDQDISWEMEPISQAESIAFLINTYSDPKKFAEQVLDEFLLFLSQDQILIIDTLKQEHRLIGKDFFQRKIEILSNKDFSKEEKIFQLAGPVRINYGDNDFSSLKFEWFKKAYASSNLTYVPKNKKINYFQSTHQPLNPFNNTELRILEDPNGPFKSFFENDYYINVVIAHPKDGDSLIPEFSNMMENENNDIIFYDGHGADNKLQMEIYNIITPDSQINLESGLSFSEFRERRDFLWKQYGKDSVSVYTRDWNLTREQLNSIDNLSWLKKLQVRKDMKIKIGVFSITDKFFINNSFPEKTLVFLLACLGGSLADDINSKVILAPLPSNRTTSGLFLNSDLKKISPYLMKDKEKKDIEINKETMRSFILLNEFKQNQRKVGTNREENKKIQNDCDLEANILCTIKLYIKNNINVALSPHVSEIKDESIIFNTYMNTGIKAEEIVKIYFDEGCDVPDNLDSLKPKWVFDNEIQLNWLGEAYTSWGENKQGPFARIVINNEKAVSQDSNIRLTGNKDCGCESDGCKEEVCLEEPTNIEYNGNNPKTDFTYVMPCAIDVYYKSCKGDNYVKIKKDKDEMLEKVRIGSDCYAKSGFSEDAVIVQNYNSGEGCDEVCKEEVVEKKPECDISICTGSCERSLVYDASYDLSCNASGFPDTFVINSVQGLSKQERSIKKDSSEFYKTQCERDVMRICKVGKRYRHALCQNAYDVCRAKCGDKYLQCNKAGLDSTKCWSGGTTPKEQYECLRAFKEPCFDELMPCRIACNKATYACYEKL